MTIGETSIFAIESHIDRAFEKPSWRGLGFFVIYICGRRYGIKSPGQTMLACSLDEVERRISRRGTHEAVFADADATEIANAYTRAVYVDHDESETYFGMSETQFTEAINSRGIVWAPDGDEAFDDSSYILQFDVDERVRLVAFTRPDGSVDPTSLREVWLSACDFYSTLLRWQDAFLAEWKSLPKHS